MLLPLSGNHSDGTTPVFRDRSDLPAALSYCVILLMTSPATFWVDAPETFPLRYPLIQTTLITLL